jgi:hypothetical protein
MSLVKNINGIHQFILNRDDIHFEAIAEQFKLNVEEVKKVAYAAEDATKKPKPIKAQAKPPKKEKPEGSGQNRKPSGYFLYNAANRENVIILLKTKAKERKFTDKDGNMTEIKTSDFSAKGEPTLAQVGQKISSMWRALSVEEREEWNTKAKNAPPIPKKEKAVKGAKKGAKNTKNATKKEESTESEKDEESEEQDEENDSEEQEDEEEEVIIKPTNSKGKGEGRTKTLPPPKGRKSGK